MLIGDKRLLVRPFFEDSQGRPEVGVAAAQRLLTRDQVDILVADIFNSQVTLAVMELAGTFNKFMMSGQPVSDEIPKKIKSDPQKYRKFLEAGLHQFGLCADDPQHHQFACRGGQDHDQEEDRCVRHRGQ